MALVPPDTSSPFGRYALNPLLSLGRRWSTGGPTWLQRYLGSKLLTRWYKNTSSPIDAEVGGLRARLYPRNNFHCRHGLLRGRFPDQDWFPRLVEGAGAGFVFLDIGANIGVFALCAARDLPPDARIVALEPHPGTRARLETNLRFNDATRVEVVPVALGAEPGTLDLFENADGNIGGFSLHNTAKSPQTNVVPVEVMPLHRLCDQMAITRIDVMKIDIEGYEDRVLMPFLASAAPALWPRRILIEHLGSDMWEVDLFAELAARGYVERERTGDNVLLERRVADA